MLPLSIRLGILALTLACKPVSKNSNAPKQGAAGSFPSSNGSGDPADALTIEIPPMIYLDAQLYTFGILSFQVKNVKNPLHFQRFLAVEKPMEISASERQDMKHICRDISVGAEPMNPTPAVDVKGDQTYYLQWRSHYSVEWKKSLGSVIAAGHKVRCVLQLKDPVTGQRAQLQLNPLAEGSAPIKGIIDRDAALKEGILLVEDSKGLIDDSSLLLVEESATINIGVKAINRETMSVKAPDIADENPCYYSRSGAETRVGNEDAQKRIDTALLSNVDFSIKKVLEAPLGGRLLKSCGDVRVSFKNKDLQSTISCGQYQRIKEEGLEAGCQWEVIVENAMDPENSQIVNLPLAQLRFQTIDLTKLGDVKPLIPQAKQNPVRNKKTKLENLSEAQSGMLEDAFDLWIAMDDSSFEDDYEEKVSSIRYRTDAEGCMQTAAFVDEVGGSVINLCDSGGYSAEYEKKRLTDPFGTLLRAQVLAHESRHIAGFKHDWLNEDYSPCEGSAASAILPYKIISECKADYCPILRDTAFYLFIHELNYSVRDDARRFQGQCKSWSDKMGLTMADIQNGK